MSSEKVKAGGTGLLVAAVLAIMIVVGSRNLAHFDAPLVGYTFATLFAAFGIAYRYGMWLQRPPTKMYWRKGWAAFVAPRFIGRNIVELGRRMTVEFAANRFIWRRGKMRWGAHWFIMSGCLLAAAITFPLVFGWVHFKTPDGDLSRHLIYVFGFPTVSFPVDSFIAFMTYHGLVWAAILCIIGVMLAMRRRMIDRGAGAVQQFGEDFLPLIMLFAISITGLMIYVSYKFMDARETYEFMTILHAVTVIFTLLWLPFGKFFHIFQRPAQLGVMFYKDQANRGPRALCRRCGEDYGSLQQVEDLITVQRELGFSYELDGEEEHYQRICPKCRRALFGLAQGETWGRQENEKLIEQPA